jgi:hypothetical protein
MRAVKRHAFGLKLSGEDKNALIASCERCDGLSASDRLPEVVMPVFRTLRTRRKLADVVVNGALIDKASFQKMLADAERALK